MAIDTTPDTSTKRETFFRLLFGQGQGYVCIAYASSSMTGFKEEFFRYPADLPGMLARITELHIGHNIWYSPMLYDSKKRRKENVVSTPSAWSDLDSCPPELLKVKPSVTIESSPGRYQGLWIFDREVFPSDAEDISRRIAYAHADDGADRTGWDLTQLLRVPLTYNYKHTDDGINHPIVKIIDVNRSKYRQTDFNMYPVVRGFDVAEHPFPDTDAVEGKTAEDLLTEYAGVLPATTRLLYDSTPQTDWSGPLWSLELTLFEAGMSREEVFTVVREAACNKYKRDGKSPSYLWAEVCKAEIRHQENEKQLQAGGVVGDARIELLTAAERIRVASEDTFIERYIAWAKSLGDAAPQYHQAGAFTILSSLLSGSIRLPTSFGTILPNLWFMILADTTLTRKSTAMDIAMDIVTDIDPDTLMATDGSLEGLLTVLSGRPGKPSVFLRDEFSGLLESMTKKDYMAGMAELLTKLYDGKMQKRVLRKEVIEVRDPILILFAGGIKNKITSLLSFEHVSSGFMPRFVFITAESDITRLKPLGPPSESTTGNREAIVNELQDLIAHYRIESTIEIKGTQIKVPQPRIWNAELTPAAWERYNELEHTMLEAGMASQRPEIMTPVYDRLSKSILKAAVLLTAAKKRADKIIIDDVDILRAIMYGEGWKDHVDDVMSNVGKSTHERQLDSILARIQKHSTNGVSRSVLMQNYHLSSRDAEAIFTTLEQRGLIVRNKVGRGEVFTPIELSSGRKSR